MAERARKLRSMVQELETELASLESLDPETRRLLQEAARDIEAALEGSQGDDFRHHHFADRLRDAAARFESSHPTLFGVVSRTIDALGQMGI